MIQNQIKHIVVWSAFMKKYKCDTILSIKSSKYCQSCELELMSLMHRITESVFLSYVLDLKNAHSIENIKHYLLTIDTERKTKIFELFVARLTGRDPVKKS